MKFVELSKSWSGLDTMADLSQDDFATILMTIRQGLRLILAGLEKWLKEHGYLRP